jgi:ketosteroid isomerase-like protein
MDASQNKQMVLAWVDAVNSRETGKMLDMLHEDFLFTCMARSPEWLKYRWNRSQFAAVPEAQGTLLKSPIAFKVNHIVAEGDTVVLEAEADTYLNNGKRYDNAYSLIFDFRDSKIVAVREYSCSHLVVETFGEFNPDNPAMNQAATQSAA